MDVQELVTNGFVRVRAQPGNMGILLDLVDRGGRVYAKVNFSTGVRLVPADQLEPVTQEQSARDHLTNGHIEAPEVLRHHLSHIRLSGRMSDMLYSLEATDTQFFAHQFKPVLKLLESPTGHLLIADEVGLGKTIEAGLIWTELAARHRFNRLLVVCPKVLCDKWKTELLNKFDISAQIMGPEELRDALSSQSLQRRGFAAICGLQSIRPRPKHERKERPADKLATAIDEIDAFDDRIDLLIIDEAHHLRNSGTQSNAVGRMMSRLARHVVMLSATPINLHSRDLHALLELVDPDTFRDPRSLERIIEANAPLIQARDALLRGAPKTQVLELLKQATDNHLLFESQTLLRAIEDITKMQEPVSKYQRARLATQIEGVNQLANVVNRTRRKDVEEHKVIRHAVAFKAEMTILEREVYEQLTEAVLGYAEALGHPPGFLTVMPQRMLASCMPAAVAHWLTEGAKEGIEDELDEDQDGQLSTPFRRELQRLARQFPSPKELEVADTKFNCFLAAITKHLADHPREKVVVFSTFLGTLDYLHRRLSRESIGTAVLDSRVKERTELLRKFERDASFRVLLSSEVGSEGIDLQFATAVVNYDLPWNPMRVEQRIGRIDRLGQKAARVTVLNLMHRNTIDERIWDRLYHRLQLCERALGGFEEVLGFEIKALERDLFSGQLTAAQQEQRIEQTAQAIENIKEHEERLEGEAAALIAHGDYVLREIRDKRDGQRWISPEDIVDYLHLGLNRLYPESRILWKRAEATIDIKLDPEARHDFSEWGRLHQIDPGPLARTASALTFRLGAPEPGSRVPRMSQSHPLLRFISDRLNTYAKVAPSTVGITVKSDVCGIPIGHYAGAVQQWEFGSKEIEMRLAVSLVNVADCSELDFPLAELVLRRALDTGSTWSTAFEELDLEALLPLIDELVVGRLEDAFEREAETRSMKMLDRLNLQLATLRRSADEDRHRINHAILSAGKRLEAANRKRLELLNERVRQRELELNSRADQFHSRREIGIILLNVVK